MLTAFDLRLIAYAAALAAAAGLIAWSVHHERELGAQAANAAIAHQHDADVAAAQAQNAKITAAQEATDHEADKFALAATLDARGAADAAQRLQQRFAAVNRCPVPNDPAASAGSPAADAGSDLRADVLRRVAAAAGLIASAADDARGRGLRAEGHYDALTPARP